MPSFTNWTSWPELSADWIRTDLPTDVRVSLEHCLWSIKAASGDGHHWKWAIISAHLAAYAAMTAHVTGTGGLGALNENSTKELIDLLNSGGNLADFKPRQAVFGELLKRCRKGIAPHAAAILLSQTEIEELTQFNDVRAEFEHFLDKKWSIDAAILPLLITRAISLVEKIEASGWAFRHAPKEARLIRQLCKRITSKLAPS